MDIAGTSSWGSRYTNSVYLKHISSLIPVAIVAFAIILLFIMILSFAVGIIFATKFDHIGLAVGHVFFALMVLLAIPLAVLFYQFC